MSEKRYYEYMETTVTLQVKIVRPFVDYGKGATLRNDFDLPEIKDHVTRIETDDVLRTVRRAFGDTAIVSVSNCQANHTIK